MASKRNEPAGTAFDRSAQSWHLYLIECLDGSIYTGITVDIVARYAAHLAGKGARYTRSHPPARLLATLACPDRSSAAQMEYRVKQLSAGEKRVFAEKLSLLAHQRENWGDAGAGAAASCNFKIATEILSPSPLARARARLISSSEASRAENAAITPPSSASEK